MKYVLSVVGMIVFGIIAVVLFARTMSNTNQQVQVGTEIKQTTDHINDKSKVQFTRYGRIVSDEDRRSMKIYITERERVIEILKGYEERIERRETFENNPDSYRVFMNALDKAGFTRVKETKVSDPTGICPSGSTFFYSLNESDEEITNLWNSTCQSLGGNLGNSGSVSRRLFTNQIPNYDEIVQGVKF